MKMREVSLMIVLFGCDLNASVCDGLPQYFQAAGAGPSPLLVYGDFSREERLSISKSGIACEGQVVIDCLELWVVPLGAPESEWYKLKDMKLDDLHQGLNELKDCVKTLTLDDENELKEDDDEEDDWESSVDNFQEQMKSIEKAKEEVDWDAAEQEEEER
eukprot:501770-Hanusia_phi.AAC.1